jgi:type IV secretion system protein VirD4
MKQAMMISTPIMLMLLAALGLMGNEAWLADLGRSNHTLYMLLGHIGLALPYLAAAALGLIALFSANGSLDVKFAGFGVLIGGAILLFVGLGREAARLNGFADRMPPGTILQYVDFYSVGGSIAVLLTGLFGLKVGLRGNAAFSRRGPRRIKGHRAIHGSSNWMRSAELAKLMPGNGGIVVGERYRVDKDHTAAVAFSPSKPQTWGAGGKSPLVAFDQSFGSTHGIIFAGSGGFKTTSVVIPTCLQYSGSMVVLDPSTEIAPMVTAARAALGQEIYTIDPKNPGEGFNVLDWIGKFGASKEEDIATVSAWLMSEKPRITSSGDDFFRTSAEQLLTGLIAYVVLSKSEDLEGVERSLRGVRKLVTKPEESLREFLSHLHEHSPSNFVKENIATFINLTPQTFSGIYATATKETHWLSYENYAAVVSGSSFNTDVIASGNATVFLNIDLSTLENHPGMARVIIGAFLKAVYNMDGDVKGHVLFLLDEAARLGYMRIIETARDAGRKYGISLLMLFQSLGQMREAFGGRDATSKWFESASFVSFAAINDPETAEYISKRCGMTTVELNQVSSNSRSGATSRTRSKQLTQRPLIQPHEVLQMRTDDQIIFTGGNPPIRCGRAMYFRRKDMTDRVAKSRFAALPQSPAYNAEASQ